MSRPKASRRSADLPRKLENYLTKCYMIRSWGQAGIRLEVGDKAIPEGKSGLKTCEVRKMTPTQNQAGLTNKY